MHGERRLGEVGQTTGPLNCALLIGRIATSPNTSLDIQWALRESLAVVAGKRPHRCSLQIPDNLVFCPHNGVIEILVLGQPGRQVVLASVVSCSVTLGEVVRLELGIVSSQQLNVNLVQIVRHQEKRQDNAFAWGSLHQDLDTTEHDVEVQFDARIVSLFLKSELQAVVSV